MYEAPLSIHNVVLFLFYRSLLDINPKKTFTPDLEDKSAIPLVVDSMENEMTSLYACWPERAFLIKGR